MTTDLDYLYGIYFNQLIRSKISPTYVEKRILEETSEYIKNYILKHTDNLLEKIKEDNKKSSESYLTWSVDFYKKDTEKKGKMVQEFKDKIENISSDDLLSFDLSKTGSVLDTIYPDTFPVSTKRELLLSLWTQQKESK